MKGTGKKIRGVCQCHARGMRGHERKACTTYAELSALGAAKLGHIGCNCWDGNAPKRLPNLKNNGNHVFYWVHDVGCGGVV